MWCRFCQNSNHFLCADTFRNQGNKKKIEPRFADGPININRKLHAGDVLASGMLPEYFQMLLIAFGMLYPCAGDTIRKKGRKERRRNKEDTQWQLTKWYWGPMRGKHNLSMRYLCATYARAMRGSYDAVGSSWSAGVSSILKAGPRHPKVLFRCVSLSLLFITACKKWKYT